MSDLINHIGRDTLPATVVEQFVRWCVLEQAKPSLLKVLKMVEFDTLIGEIQAAENFDVLLALSVQANTWAKSQRERGRTGLLGYSAAEAAAFEFGNMLRATQQTQFDAEAVAFFAARVHSWAGWAATQFSDPSQKAIAEKAARDAQETYLR